MSQSLPLSPNPSLVAIVLIVKSQAGPRFVFHWPPNSLDAPCDASGTNSTSSRTGRADSGIASEDSTTRGDGYEDNDTVLPGYCSIRNTISHRQSAGSGVWTRNENDTANSRFTIVGGTTTSFNQTRGRSLSVNIQAENDRLKNNDGNVGNSPPDWEYFFGKRTYIWEKLLSPSESFNKQKFELQLNDMAFVGWPVFRKPNGTWSRGRRKTHDKQNRGSPDAPGKVSELSVLASRDTATDALASESERDEDIMTMFNVVFVLNPPHLEHHLRVKEQYHNIVKKFGKGLQSEQARAEYVWEQAKVISQVKEKAREASMPAHNHAYVVFF